MSLADLFRKISPEPPGPAEFILCCLGNPGKKYEKTRHNSGFMTADLIAAERSVKINRLKFHGMYGEFLYGGKKIVLLKPQTFMNDSGVCAREALDWYKLPPEKLIVVCDDLELPCGKIRVRSKGSDGGHNGLKSIIYHTGSDRFPRVRIGIGRPENPEFSVIDYVLGRFTDAEYEKVETAVKRASAAALEIASGSPESAANLFNGA
jgi:PTH1 family peptidyl-tRNA hydrolase